MLHVVAQGPVYTERHLRKGTRLASRSPLSPRQSREGLGDPTQARDNQPCPWSLYGGGQGAGGKRRRREQALVPHSSREMTLKPLVDGIKALRLGLESLKSDFETFGMMLKDHQNLFSAFGSFLLRLKSLTLMFTCSECSFFDSTIRKKRYTTLMNGL